MYKLIFIFFVLLVIHFNQSAEIESVRLVGDSSNFINLNSNTRYILQCRFRTGYDDPINYISWYKDGKLVYRYVLDSSLSSAYGPLTGRVETSGQNLQNLHFKRLSLHLAGNYVCEVTSGQKVRSDPIQVTVIDVPSDNFITTVSLLAEEAVPKESNETVSTEQDDANCTLLWDFQTPAIYPRPNITCGYYSYLHDDVVESLPAGLTMYNLQNGSYQADFHRIPIQVSEIPKENRLGCSVTVPDTNFKRVVKFEDNFAIDHLIDSEGCPSVALNPSFRLQVNIQNGYINCRGDLVPTSTSEPMKVSFSCAHGELAAFNNGTVLYQWSRTLFCNPADLSWYSQDANSRRSPNLTNLPSCVPDAGNYARKNKISEYGLLLMLGIGLILGYLKEL